VVAAAVLILTGRDSSPPGIDLGALSDGSGGRGGDPFTASNASDADLERRAAAGHSHVLYAESPGGVFATARRVERYRPLVERTARESGTDPDVLEGLLFLEGAGRPDAMASEDPEAAAGLTQILAETGTSLLGMSIDVRRSGRLTRRIRRAQSQGLEGRVRRLEGRRRRVDDRFAPAKAIAAAGRYLELARKRFGRSDLAVESYHSGIGNLEQALRAYAGGDASGKSIADVVEEADLSYAKLYFGSSPRSHEAAYRIFARLGDDSATYLWRVFAAREIMRLFRNDEAKLDQLDALQTAKGSDEEVLHPPGDTKVFEDAGQIEDAYGDGDLDTFPDEPGRTGLRRDPRMGQLARRLDQAPRVYRGLRPQAFALATFLGQSVRELSGSRAPLTITSTVRDTDYQRLLVRRNPEATDAYSLHTTGFAFDIRRRYPGGRRQAEAFQFALDRLQSLNLIAWVREPGAIHITASGEAAELESLLE